MFYTTNHPFIWKICGKLLVHLVKALLWPSLVIKSRSLKTEPKKDTCICFSWSFIKQELKEQSLLKVLKKNVCIKKKNKVENLDRKWFAKLSVLPRNTYFSCHLVFVPNKIIGKWLKSKVTHITDFLVNVCKNFSSFDDLWNVLLIFSWRFYDLENVTLKNSSCCFHLHWS